MSRQAVVEKIAEVAERVGASEGIEVVDVELKGAGRSRMLRLTIDKPGGVTHADCELMSQQVGTILDVEGTIPGEGYTLEVTSPGVERKLSRPRDFERFVGEKIKVTLREPAEGQKHWEGRLTSFADGVATVEPRPGQPVTFRLDQVEKANLKFEWGASASKGTKESA